jgi:2-keto-4-pentenoate hydratase/2-oxohepta-3-ene-1,7-dioic acid hydratase in catechol pathway
MRLVRYAWEGEIGFGELRGDQVWPWTGSPLGGGAAAHDRQPIDLAAVTLLVPCEPTKIIAIGRNYAEHAAEHAAAVPTAPLIFLKAPSSLLAPGQPIVLTPFSQQVEHEAELAVVIGRRCRSVALEDVAALILGYTCANDVTARDLQRQDGQWARGKSFDTFCPLGPWIETDLDVTALDVTCHVQGQLRQRGNTADMVFAVDSLVSYVSRMMTLEPGDVILTGTPAGVGPLHPGDTVEVRVEGIGTLHNPVVAGA